MNKIFSEYETLSYVLSYVGGIDGRYALDKTRTLRVRGNTGICSAIINEFSHIEYPEREKRGGRTLLPSLGEQWRIPVPFVA